MKVYAVLGSAPLGRDRLSLKEINQREVLISFYDYGKAFTDLATIDQLITEKHSHERKDHNQP